MKKFIINYDKQTLLLQYEGEEFYFDLKEGDKGDFWHSFINKNGLERDINFHQEDETQKPSLAIYGLEEKEGEIYINTSDEEVIEDFEQVGNMKEYFK